jgi:anti-sigma regulatory factor (Ser/Thr protein kinase)
MDELHITADGRQLGGRATIRLSPDPTSARVARQFVGDALKGWGTTDQVETAMLLTSELVTNAILHARTDITVTLRGDGPLTVTVLDQSVDGPSGRQVRDPLDSGGGLRLVDALAASWGVTTEERGKAVWFELAN